MGITTLWHCKAAGCFHVVAGNAQTLQIVETVCTTFATIDDVVSDNTR
jgi:hypothetical protein